MTQLANVLTYTEQFVPAQVGAGATEICWTDRQAYTVVRVSPSGKTCWIQRDNAIRTDERGRTDSGQQYRYEPCLTAPLVRVTMTKKGWRIGGLRGAKVIMGVRDEHYDYGF